MKPLYPYTCPACSNEWEERRRMLDSAPRRCPKCGAAARRRYTATTRRWKEGRPDE